MLKVSEAQSTGASRELVLGFDAGCSTCSDLAARIEERVGDRLAVRNLSTPELLAWRKQALGENAEWAPTLFEVEGERVRAWTGWRIGYTLSRKIGAAATWRVMQALGEAGAAQKVEESSLVEKPLKRAAEAVTGVSRRQFLKGVSGAAVAMAVLSGTDFLTRPVAAAATGKESPYDIVKSRRVTGAELQTMARSAATTRDTKNLAGTALSTPTKIGAAKPQGYVHTLRNGIVVNAVVYVLSGNRLLAHFYFSKPLGGRGATSLAKLWQRNSANNQVLVKASEGGYLWRKPAGIAAKSVQGDVVPLRDCPPVGGGDSGDPPPQCAAYRSYECLQWKVTTDCTKTAAVTGIACVGCAASVVFAPESFGATLLTTGTACFGCGYGSGDTYQTCCAQFGYVTRYDYSRC
jgi:hypothetical protein